MKRWDLRYLKLEGFKEMKGYAAVGIGNLLGMLGIQSSPANLSSSFPC
jgi:hypothetical protein